jgi:hypothetical protein
VKRGEWSLIVEQVWLWSVDEELQLSGDDCSREKTVLISGERLVRANT